MSYETKLEAAKGELLAGGMKEDAAATIVGKIKVDFPTDDALKSATWEDLQAWGVAKGSARVIARNFREEEPKAKPDHPVSDILQIPALPSATIDLQALVSGGQLTATNPEMVLVAVEAFHGMSLGLQPSEIASRIERAAIAAAKEQDAAVDNELMAAVRKAKSSARASDLGISVDITSADRREFHQEMTRAMKTLRELSTQCRTWAQDQTSAMSMANPLGVLGLLTAGQSSNMGALMGQLQGALVNVDTTQIRASVRGAVEWVNRVFTGKGCYTAVKVAAEVRAAVELLQNPKLAQVLAVKPNRVMKKLGLEHITPDLEAQKGAMAAYTWSVLHVDRVPQDSMAQVTFVASLIQRAQAITWELWQRNVETSRSNDGTWQGVQSVERGDPDYSGGRFHDRR